MVFSLNVFQNHLLHVLLNFLHHFWIGRKAERLFCSVFAFEFDFAPEKVMRTRDFKSRERFDLESFNRIFSGNLLPPAFLRELHFIVVNFEFIARALDGVEDHVFPSELRLTYRASRGDIERNFGLKYFVYKQVPRSFKYSRTWALILFLFEERSEHPRGLFVELHSLSEKIRRGFVGRCLDHREE